MNYREVDFVALAKKTNAEFAQGIKDHMSYYNDHEIGRIAFEDTNHKFVFTFSTLLKPSGKLIQIIVFFFDRGTNSYRVERIDAVTLRFLTRHNVLPLKTD